jgi:hypothetical protein
MTDTPSPNPPVVKPTIVTVPSTSSGSGASGLVTAEGHPIIIQIVKPITIIGVRALRVYIQTILGLLSAGIAVPSLLPASDFFHLLGTCASLSAAAAVISVLTNMVAMLAKFDQTNPTLSA